MAWERHDDAARAAAAGGTLPFVTATAWALLVVAELVFVVVAYVVLSALLAMLALALPAGGTRSSRLRMALASVGVEASRRGALSAVRLWLRAFGTTSRRMRLVRVLMAAMLLPASFAASRWRGRAVLLTGSGACLRVVQRRSGSWRLVDVAGWPVGAGRARPLVQRVCAAADAAGVTVTLTAASAKVAVAAYEPLGFRATRTGSLRMERPGSPDRPDRPETVVTADGPEGSQQACWRIQLSRAATTAAASIGGP